MGLRYKIKDRLPANLLPLAKRIYNLSKVPHYWIPYAFKQGKAWHPKSITFEITYRCNLRCAMCPQATDYQQGDSKLRRQQRQRKELIIGEIFKLINDASEMGVSNFSLTGGEVFIRKDVFQVINYIKAKELNCSILTNGTLINKEVAKNIVGLGVDKMTFSLDGPKEIHNRIRRSSKAFDALMEAIQFIQEEKIIQNKSNPYLALSCTISSLNAQYLTDLIDIAGKYRINMNYGYMFYSTQEMEEMTMQILTMDDVKGEDQDLPEYLKHVDPEVVRRQIEDIRSKAKRQDISVNFQPNLKGQEIYRRFHDDSFAYVNKCFYPWYAFRVNPYGDVYPCSMGIKVGNICKEKLSAIWNNNKYIQFRNALKKNRLFPKCTKCCVLSDKLWSYLPGF